MPSPGYRLAHAPARIRAAAFILAICLVPTVSLLICAGNEQRYAQIRTALMLAGFALPLLYWHGYRLAGFPPYLLTAAFAASTADTETAYFHPLGATIAVALSSAALASVIRSGWCVGRSDGITSLEWGTLGLAATSFLAVGMACAGGFADEVEPALLSRVVAIGLLAIACVASWMLLYRPAFELAVEPILWWMFRIRTAGPGMAEFPRRGPCLVVANHACWFDPFILAKILPHPVTPMMTSRFYDLPVLRWLMRGVIRAIRVPDRAVRQEAPEIDEAIAAVDRGEWVVIFPEGFLRRTDEKPIKRFGRGVWQILKARPDTPVVACWIEGNWGSYTSYFNGKPTHNKRPDFRKRIGIGVATPVTFGPAELENHLPTRLALMNRVAAARAFLGLASLPSFEIPKVDAEERDEEG